MRDVFKPVDFQITDEELHKVLREIDDELRAKGTRLFGRELQGWTLFCRKFHLKMAMSDPLAVRILDWFSKQYGDRLKGDLDFGKTVVEIRHDLYSLRLCRLYGTEIVYCDPLLLGQNLGPRLATSGFGVRTNLFDYLQGVTREFIKSLTPDECNNLLQAHRRGFLALSRMSDVEGAPYGKEARDDLLQSAAQLTSQSQNCGLSRWGSLQAAEKVLKSFITQNGTTPQKTHNLTNLVAAAASVGLPPIDSSLIRSIQCNPEVRYSARSVGKAEALNAHYAALSLCAEIAPLFKSQSGWISEARWVSYSVNSKVRPMKALIIKRGKIAAGIT
jgi:HEPN domain-containing protein